jgi:hypothetical protein
VAKKPSRTLPVMQHHAKAADGLEMSHILLREMKKSPTIVSIFARCGNTNLVSCLMQRLR